MGYDPKRNWSLTTDGDLWQHFYEMAKAKTTQAIKLTWVKGHATAQHIQDGITTTINKEGNDAADLIADDGVKAHGENLIYYADLYTKRHTFYAKFYTLMLFSILLRLT